MNHALHSTAGIRAIEAAHAAKHPRQSLMQRAGAAIAALAIGLLPRKKNAAILVLAGPGNNGGDAWVAAVALKKAGHRVTLVAPAAPAFTDATAGASMLPARTAHSAWLRGKGEIRRDIPDKAVFDLIIDGLFGIGITRAPAAPFAGLINRANQLRVETGALILAIDVPSGLVADTGVALKPTIEADHTLTFLGMKPGLFTAAGKDHTGAVHLDFLGTMPTATDGALLTGEALQALIPQRRHHSHKGSYGNVGIIGGAEGMMGAAILAARAALMMGPGKAYVGLAAKDVPGYDPINPELMLRRADELVGSGELSALAIGMGLGTDKSAPRLLSAVLGRDLPILLDADALNLIAATPSLEALLTEQPAGAPWRVVLTPHPGEAARLLGVSTAQVEADRVANAIALARRFRAVTVLKGAGSIVAAPDGRYWINTSGNPGMASGGMGDALSGMIAAFLAQGMNGLDAARLGVYLHGAAADGCMAHGMAPHGLTASEVIFEARSLLNAGLVADEHAH
jgi:ADP-dependent NAD(P)H-hydrate dehydratase / NAD(P)H-hydrate epimerase